MDKSGQTYIFICADLSANDRHPKRTSATEIATALHRTMMHDDIGSIDLSGFGHVALQLGATQSKIYAHEFDVGFYGEEQVRVLLRNAKQMDRPADTCELGFKR